MAHVSLAGPAGALSYSQHYLQPISVTLLRGIVSSECMVGRRNRTASRASLVCMKSRNTPVVVAAPSGALKQLNLREQRIAVAFVGGSPNPPCKQRTQPFYFFPQRYSVASSFSAVLLRCKLVLAVCARCCKHYLCADLCNGSMHFGYLHTLQGHHKRQPTLHPSPSSPCQCWAQPPHY